MNSETFSLFMWCTYEPQTGATQVRVMDAATNEGVHIKNGKFLLRVSVDTGASLVRCIIRHTASGREAHIQGGLNLRAFVKDCLLDENNTTLTSMEQAREDGQEPFDE